MSVRRGTSVPRLAASLALGGVAMLALDSHGEESTTAVSFSVGDDGRVRIEVPSADDLYHVLYYRASDDATEYAVTIRMGAAGSVVLSEPLPVGRVGAYRVATHSTAAPADTDGDGVDDLAELARSEAVARAPLNAAGPLRAADGAVAIPDLATFRVVSQLGTVAFTKFIVVDVAAASAVVYHMNTNAWQWHGVFSRKVLGWPLGRSFDPKHLTGELIYHPNVVAPNGEAGTFRWQNQYSKSRLSFEDVSRAHELIGASMPFLRNNLVYHPVPRELAAYRQQKARFDASRVPVYLENDLFEGSVFAVLNAGVGYGLLRVLEPGERPMFRDVVVLKHLPNELAAVAGVISLERQTPLSHVNLRAVQNGVPNAYLGIALDDPMVAGLVGRYVRYVVAANPEKRFEWTNPTTGEVEERAGYLVTEATAEEVAAHHEARRPATAQTPARDLTVTTYRALGAVGFADADAFGVKTANLATLRTFVLANVEVPDGYALPFYYYDEFMKHNGFYEDVNALLADDGFKGSIAVRDAKLGKLRRRIRNGAVPGWMTTALGTVQGLFAEGTAIRCRSSTNNEDLPGFSGAGLYDSVTHRPTEGHLEKSVKQVFASLWNLRAFEEREFYRVDHKAAAMGVLLHPNYSGEQANGVAVSDDPFYGTEDRFYVNAQVGEELVTNPSASAVPEELLLGAGEEFETTLVQRSSLVADDARVLSEADIALVQAALRTIHGRFRTLYGVGESAEFAIEIEFKITADGAFAVKQARPWVY